MINNFLKEWHIYRCPLFGGGRKHGFDCTHECEISSNSDGYSFHGELNVEPPAYIVIIKRLCQLQLWIQNLNVHLNRTILCKLDGQLPHLFRSRV